MPPRKPTLPPAGETIIPCAMEDVMHQSMMPYSEYVILERALPRVEDGLKPVQRRILYTMYELGLNPDKPHRKCARIVGDCLGKYHPHGDSSVYDALARMAQPFVMRGVLVDGHGNFGSIDGDPPAAMRYTEARMTPLALELLQGIEKDTVGFHLNFDDTQKEPDLLPGRYPNLLVNGASGIAVGLATNIPPHNLGEAINAVIAQIDKPGITTGELMAIMPGPDFPTGGILADDEEIRAAYETGRGRLRLRAKVHIESGRSGRTLIVIDQVPYQVNKALMLEKILRLSEDKKALLGGIHDIRDESDRSGMRAVIELKKDVDPDQVLAVLYKYSDLQTTFGVNLVAIAQGKPKQMGIKEVISHYIRFQKEVVTRRTRHDLDQAKAKAHILEGLIVAVDNLDEVIRLIRASKTPKEAREKLMQVFSLTLVQAQAILDMRLQRLTNLEILTLRREYGDLLKLIARLEGILKSEKKLLSLIKEELAAVRDRYADPRRTSIQIIEDKPIILEEEMPAPEETWVVVTRAGLIKRVSPRLYERHMATEEEGEMPLHRFKALTSDRLLVFSDQGMCYPVQVESLPDLKPKDRGLNPAGILQGLEKEENLLTLLHLEGASYEGTLLFYTAGGMVKRTALSQYDVRRSRFVALKLKSGDSLAGVLRESDESSLLMVTGKGMAIHYPLEDVPVMGRVAAGVKGMSLAAEDRVIACFQHDSAGEVLLATDKGYFKRCLLVDFDPQGRGGKGVKALTFLKNGSNGEALAAALKVTDPVDLVITQKAGTVTTINSEWVKIEMRSGKGNPMVIAVLDDIIEDVRVKI
ncbi:MAG: DNA topoisomerase 4 subunit A [Bacillota bacterium]|nr:DNA topoisomerase 4 subunit A [Bacillota bacterium]